MSLEDQKRRLPAGGRIDRSRPLSFQFDGQRYGGFEGDTLASALLANDVTLVGRSFKYHRPRGIFSAGSEEPNALVELGVGAAREPNTKATTVRLHEGLQANSQNCWPNVRFDVGAVNNLLSPFFVAGFYYKTLMWPAGFWERVYEPLIRRAAGMGRVSEAPDPDEYEKRFAFCDVLVIGAGPAGLAAALAAARSGARVILCDEDFLLGGRLNAERYEIDGAPATTWVDKVVAELAQTPNVRLMPGASVFGAYDGGYGALETLPAGGAKMRLWRIVARRTILAAGAIERHIPFSNNDRPGVMTAAATRTYANRYGVAPAGPAVVFTCNDDGWRTAFDLAAIGAPPLVADSRGQVSPDLLAQAARQDIEVMTGAVVTATQGGPALKSVSIRGADGAIRQRRASTLAVAGGWNPTLALSTHLGGRPAWSEDIAAFIPGDCPGDMQVVGAASGALGLSSALRGGLEAGRRAAADCGFDSAEVTAPITSDEPRDISPLWHVGLGSKKAFVDLQHDVTVADVALAEREGFRSVEHLKRYTTLGMGTDQGKTSNVLGLALMAELTGRGIPEVGVTLARPPFTPVPIGAFAGGHRGRHFRPTRLTASHGWGEANGAVFTETGLWLRAQWFARPGETDWLTSVSREVVAVRSAVGVCDVSTLGKIDVQGADAGAFLDAVYINTFSSLAVGKTRYGLMLREDGLVLDDGTTARLAEDHFVVSTTTANAVRVMQHLEHARQVTWPHLDVQLASVTEQWSQFAIAGPRSRDLLADLLGEALDVSDAAFPFMACQAFQWRGIGCRLFRVSFSGERAFELAVPARCGGAAWEAIMAAGAPYGVTPYGTEALGVLRIEKGHAAGPELNGPTTAADLGLGKMMSRKKDYIGRILSGRPGLTDADRPALVGLKPLRAGVGLRGGGHLLNPGARPSLEADQGYVTSVAYSPSLESWIGLALLTRGAQRHGEQLVVHDPLRGADVEVTVCPPSFVDPAGERLHG